MSVPESLSEFDAGPQPIRENSPLTSYTPALPVLRCRGSFVTWLPEASAELQTGDHREREQVVHSSTPDSFEALATLARR